ncbi:hypothetical protein [Nocardia stercoris]|uniref:hypothetical protein n=1 Tax=Nocardia stercoris TaxID=2483361 RepID=UPI0011C3DE83|nr:hypothetical protein [Nocardia stercoris]
MKRGNRFWLVHIPELNQWTQARNLREVDAMVRDLVAMLLGIPDDSFEVEMSVELPAEAQEHWARSRQLHELADALRNAAAEEARRAAQQLSAVGLTLRDIGQSLEISFQRAGQLTAGAAEVRPEDTSSRRLAEKLAGVYEAEEPADSVAADEFLLAAAAHLLQLAVDPGRSADTPIDVARVSPPIEVTELVARVKSAAEPDTERSIVVRRSGADAQS